MTAPIELLPCPFCGHSAHIENGPPELFYAECTRGDGCGINGHICDSAAAAAAAWNRRSSAQPAAPVPVPMTDWRAEWERERANFHRETLRTSELSAMLRRWMEQHEAEHGPGPWSRGCSVCALVGESRALLAEAQPPYDGVTTHPEFGAPEGVKLWLWKNFIDGRPEYWAFDNPFPIHLDHGDPQTLGEPCGYAIFKPSRQGRVDVSEAEVLRRIATAQEAK